MASPQHRTTIENLPGEVLSDIFMRLLARQLAQMRCVSKSWNALLSHSSFVKSHLHHSIQNNDEILLFFGTIFSFDRSPFTACTSRSPDLKLSDFIKLPINTQCELGGGLVIGSVNGLICFYYESCIDEYFIHIWNPSLSATLTLPRCLVTVHENHVGFGFGFDPKSDDYKVVKIKIFTQETNMGPQCEVYSMRKGSWESISQSFPSHITKLREQNEVCVDGHDGHLHWICDTDLEGKPDSIVAFDLGAETFREIPLPDSLLYHDMYKPPNVLGVLSGKLCVMSCVKDGEWEVWVMDEYGVAESWVKRHVFPQFSGDMIPYGFTLHNELLFQVDNDYDRFALYDPVTAKSKTFKITPKESYISKVVEYVDSLVWIVPANRLQI